MAIEKKVSKKPASAKKVEVAQSEKQVGKEPVPFEADQREYRRPKRPTRANIAKQSQAVVMFVWQPDKFGVDFDAPADRDFEPFNNEYINLRGEQVEEAVRFFTVQDDWAAEDAKKFGDLWHATILLDDTTEEGLHVKSISVRGGTAKWRTEVAKRIREYPQAIFSRAQRERLADEGKLNDGAKKVRKVKNNIAKNAPVIEKMVPKPRKNNIVKNSVAKPDNGAKIAPIARKRNPIHKAGI